MILFIDIQNQTIAQRLNRKNKYFKGRGRKNKTKYYQTH